VALEAVLNLLWAAIGVSALALLAFSESGRAGSARRRLYRLCSVAMVLLALFPCVSASDDYFCFSLLQTHSGKHGGVGAPLPEDPDGRTAGQHLARLFQALDHVPLASVYSLTVMLVCVALVDSGGRAASPAAVLCRTGRAPPSI
jgi:hypothetical protein